jgi:hypothetical protein
MTIENVTAKQLREIVSYDPTTGVFIWRKSTGSVWKGSIAGCLKNNGYIRIGRFYLAHRLAWLYVHGEWPIGEIDHINGVKHDNRIANLRVVSPAENRQNTAFAQRNSKTGALGTRRTRNGKYTAQIQVKSIIHHLGTFRTLSEAKDAYQFAKERFHKAWMREFRPLR